MANAATLATADKATTKNGSDAPVMMQANPFVRAATQTVEGAFHDSSTMMSASSAVQVQDVDIPAFGYLRSILLVVTASGGAAGGNNADAHEDAPFNVLQDITLKDVNGRPLVGPLSGFDVYLANKWGGYTYADEPKDSPLYTAPDTDGDFQYIVRLPVEVSERDGLCALPNQNSSATYKLAYTVAAGSTVYDTSPDTLPSVRVRAYAEYWSPVEPTDPFGKPNMTQLPAAGSTQHWTKSTPDVGGGDRRIRMTRVGNMLRTLIFVLRTSAGVRTDADFPADIRVELDQRNLFVQSADVLRQQMWERSGHNLDTGVLVCTFAADLDGKIGFEMRDQWVATTEATRLELVGSFGNSASSLQVLTNDVAPVGTVHI